MGATAHGLLKQLSAFEFILTLECLYKLFQMTNYISICLQHGYIGMLNFMPQTTIEILDEQFSNQFFNERFDTAMKIAVDNGILIKENFELSDTRSSKRYNLILIMKN